ncbi:hypothetical protein mRhiFer1_009457 [Rhinolophus ferrumequinum]|uniref:Uncharacterized protein n=1 Tax=Rhinolophus ferrumequinum TaxID=59479 RepID=A0A7J7RIX2_RHIFE|nr:hypothetical protein mRhiFer1_009457 [Rhinolophus ferrumequinum]
MFIKSLIAFITVVQGSISSNTHRQQTSIFYKAVPESSDKNMKRYMICNNSHTVLFSVSTSCHSNKVQSFSGKCGKKFALVYVLCAYTCVTTCLTMTHVCHSGTSDTHICSCSGLARCTKCHKIQNDRKYKQQFVFQV